MMIDVRYSGGFNPELDREIEEIVGSESVSSGFAMPTGERDLQFEVHHTKTNIVLVKLRALGVKAERKQLFSAVSGDEEA